MKVIKQQAWQVMLNEIDDVIENGNDWELWNLEELTQKTLKRVAIAQQGLKESDTIKKLLSGELPNINHLSKEHSINADTRLGECNNGKDLATVLYCKTTICQSGEHIIQDESVPFCCACNSLF